MMFREIAENTDSYCRVATRIPYDSEGSVLQAPFPTNHTMTGFSLTKVGVSQFLGALWRYSFPR